MTAIADFEQRWRQRGKTLDCSFKKTLQNFYQSAFEWPWKCFETL